MERIGFYIRTEPYGFLSNFHRAYQRIDGKIYRTNEHYYQSMKARDSHTEGWIASAPKAFHAMKAGRALRENETMPEWETTKVGVMLTGLRAKFSQNPCLKQALFDTGDAELFEDSPTDMFWGGQLEGSKNMLGKLLMQVRDELRGDTHESQAEASDTTTSNTRIGGESADSPKSDKSDFANSQDVNRNPGAQ